MAIAHRGTGAQHTFNGTTSVAPAFPATVENGDLALCVIGHATATITVSAVPSGWALVPMQATNNNPRDASTDYRQWLYYKVCDGSEDSTTPTWTISATTTGGLAAIVVYSGVDTADPFDVDAISNLWGNSANLTILSITTVTDGAWSVFTMGADGEATFPGAVYSTATNYTERVDMENTTQITYIGLQDREIVTAGATGTAAVTAAESDNHCGFHVALKPSSGTVFTKSATATLTLTPSLVRSPNKVASAGLTLTASVVKNTNKIRSATLTLTPTLSKNTNKVLNAALTLSASVVRNTNKVTSATLSFLASVATQFNSGSGQVFTQTVTATIALTSSVQRVVGKRATAALTLTPTVTRAVGKRITAALILIPSVSRGMHKVVSAVLVLNASVTKGTHKAATAALTLTATVTKATRKVLSAALTLTGNVASVFRVYVPHVIGKVLVSIFPVGRAEGGMITVGKAEGSVVKTGDIGVEVIEG